ncbi:MAG: hypothetical protein IPP90_05170 [Gemmatimonadaceae bacterium]|nr:hypothetical protein [Gemmatimonadaceae bacterium]
MTSTLRRTQMAYQFATLVWECFAGEDHAEIHLQVLAVLEANGIAVLDTPMGIDTGAPDTSLVVFRFTTGAQLTAIASDLDQLPLSFVFTTSPVGNTKAYSRDVDGGALSKVTG